ncbi:uncharacterized protein MKK02DRAFT_38782 [Dioszegia hungarica]|uniref:Uncharacterized protein n=1 Tax=Dioszegia hungarica TaxID=4972 RepID=A0AA38LUN9_9TREE|nr:uncharacterized protein MKK02DRAFT_38782 [Dioszegia hungarica]KAI9634111.1 hypothetical protein MKK02DRAFT_38782 [Dioszegia hungarica]
MSDSRQPRPSASEPTASRDPTNYQASDDALSASKSLRALVAHLTAPPPVPRLPPVSDSPNVTFTYTPGFPNFGPQQKAIGILAQTREDNLASACRTFPSLSAFDPARISFDVRLYDNSDRAEWVRVMDKAWKSLAQREGLRVRVVVEESPEDRALCEAHDRQVLGTIVGVIIGSTALGPVVLAAMNRK